jgi:CRP/FNR family cyclic AMP-dependent transcriptional regulator
MSHAGMLREADIFQDLTTEQIERIASICEEKHYNVGELVFEETSSSDELYIITRGQVEILVDPALVSDRPDAPSRPTTIAILRRGQSFGEMALVDRGVRSASARSASSETSLIIIPRKDLIQICDDDPMLGYRLMYNLAADLALKIRGSGLMIRENLLYSRREDSSSAGSVTIHED